MRPDPQRLSIGIYLYEVLWQIIRWLILPIAWLIPSLRPQLEKRTLETSQLQTWSEQRHLHQRCTIFFCSSAGEYEQAKPLMSRLRNSGEVYVILVFVSVSGRRFAEAQHEDIPYLMAPWDSPSAWNTLFQALRPDSFVIVRYELWPGFLNTARAWAPVYLIDAVRSPGLDKLGPSRYLRKRLVALCQKIFVVGKDDQQFYAQLLHLSVDQISLVGDTKYDRVLERLQERDSKRHELRAQLAVFMGHCPILILGSAWPQDLEVLLSVYGDLQKLRPGIKLILAPHDISPAMVSKMEARVREIGLSLCRAQLAGLAAAQANDDVLLIDMIGILPELYALADIAWVGGAHHYRVHNVLEPACQGLYVCFGPNFQTSQEACQLVASDLVKVIRTGQDFLEWVRGLHWQGRPPHKQLYEAVLQHKGASDRILKAIEADRIKIVSS